MQALCFCAAVTKLCRSFEFPRLESVVQYLNRDPSIKALSRSSTTQLKSIGGRTRRSKIQILIGTHDLVESPLLNATDSDEVLGLDRVSAPVDFEYFRVIVAIAFATLSFASFLLGKRRSGAALLSFQRVSRPQAVLRSRAAKRTSLRTSAPGAPTSSVPCTTIAAEELIELRKVRYVVALCSPRFGRPYFTLVTFSDDSLLVRAVTISLAGRS